jgi:hypothetical protein
VEVPQHPPQARKEDQMKTATGTVLEVNKEGEFDHEVVVKLPSGKTASFTTVWERLPKVGEVVPADVVLVFERLVK